MPWPSVKGVECKMIRDVKEMIKNGFNERELAAELGLSNTAAYMAFNAAKQCIDVATYLKVAGYDYQNYRSTEAKKFAIDYQKDDLVGPRKYTRSPLANDRFDDSDTHPLDASIGRTKRLIVDPKSLSTMAGGYRSTLAVGPAIYSKRETLWQSSKYKTTKINA